MADNVSAVTRNMYFRREQSSWTLSWASKLFTKANMFTGALNEITRYFIFIIAVTWFFGPSALEAWSSAGGMWLYMWQWVRTAFASTAADNTAVSTALFTAAVSYPLHNELRTYCDQLAHKHGFFAPFLILLQLAFAIPLTIFVLMFMLDLSGMISERASCTGSQTQCNDEMTAAMIAASRRMLANIWAMVAGLSQLCDKMGVGDHLGGFISSIFNSDSPGDV
jgi:hypothetical protein